MKIKVKCVCCGLKKEAPETAGIDGTLNKTNFNKELENLINRHSKENESDTPDWVLAEYLERCLTAFNACINMRERWYGRELGRNICKGEVIKDNTKHEGDIFCYNPLCNRHLKVDNEILSFGLCSDGREIKRHRYVSRIVPKGSIYLCDVCRYVVEMVKI
jgi:hypothetical protein